MIAPKLYRGVWPQNVNKVAKYAVRFVEGAWKITVLYDAGDGLTFLAVEGGGASLIEGVNAIKQALQSQPGGAFYVNEYRHVLVPVTPPSGSGSGAHYYAAGKLQGDLEFDFEGRRLTTRPIDAKGEPLKPGDKWIGPRPGIPYVLAAGGRDIYSDRPALTDTDPPAVRPGVTLRLKLSQTLKNEQALARAVRPIATVRGYQGGRFYVNENGAIFTPVGSGDGNGTDHIYCGQVDLAAWFPEPPLGLA